MFLTVFLEYYLGIGFLGSSIDSSVLSYLKKHPYSKPREIADGLGFSIVTVRYSLLRLRERGLVVRTSRGYVARGYAAGNLGADEAASLQEPEFRRGVEDLRERVSELEKTLEDVLENLSRLEKDVSELKVFVKALQVPGGVSKRQRDFFLERLSQEKIMTIAEARKEASRSVGSLEYYVDKGHVVIIGGFVVDKDFYETLLSRMPIKVEDMNSLSAKEKILVEAMISEGIAYIDKGREVRLA